MYRASPEMLQYQNIPGIAVDVKGTEMNVLERQMLALKWQQEQSCFTEPSIQSMLSAQAEFLQGFTMSCGPSPNPQGSTLNGLLTQNTKTGGGVNNGWIDFGMPNNRLEAESSGIQSIIQVNNSGYGVNHAISRTSSCPPLVAETAVGQLKVRQPITLDQRLSGTVGRESFKKIKAEKTQPPKVGAEADKKSKKRKACLEEEESITTSQKSNKKSNSGKHSYKEINGGNDKKNTYASGCTSSEVQKPDYIHVRARRGQATDSHSLAERVRREKISERMKHLQDLVPGCNKITGKAGMLDEIINYVQSLQTQVELLSMKLAAANPMFDSTMNDLIANQVLGACSTSMLTIGAPPDMTSTDYLNYNPIQQSDPVYGYKISEDSIDMGIQRTISAQVSVPETFIDQSCFNQIPSSLPWDADLQSICCMEFQQDRYTSSQLQAFTGNFEASNIKMEM